MAKEDAAVKEDAAAHHADVVATADAAVHHADVAATAGAVDGHDDRIRAHSDDNDHDNGRADGVVAVLEDEEDALEDAID